MTVPNKIAPDDVDSASAAPPAPRHLSPAAARALAEAEARRAAIDAEIAARPAEKGGRGGLDPNRYGDWEITGITADF